MKERVVVRQGAYHDSAFLMRLSGELSTLKNVSEAVLLMGTEMNRKLLEDAGFDPAAYAGATPMDMVVAFRATDDAALDKAEGELEALLAGAGRARVSGEGGLRAGSLEEAAAEWPDAALVSVAVPGTYAAYVARQALSANRHVFLFSDNVDLADEMALKKEAVGKGLLMMGPDCGTAIISGVGLGFSNRMRVGPVGIVGASGTGIQEIASLLDGEGVGITHAIGTGSRDLSAEVNGLMTEFGLRLLADDEGTKVIVLVAKHPDESVAARMHSVLVDLGKPVVVRYLGTGARKSEGRVYYGETLDHAGRAASALAQGKNIEDPDPAKGKPGSAARETGRMPGRVSGRMVGLFGGGSLASEAGLILERAGHPVTVPDRPIVPGLPLDDYGPSHLVVDVGEDFYTVGKPHPMVDQTVRCELIESLGSDPEVGMLLFDLVLGDGSHHDPAPEIVEAVNKARADRKGKDLTDLTVIGSVTGTDSDPQETPRQKRVLERAGIIVEGTAAKAAYLAAATLDMGNEGRPS